MAFTESYIAASMADARARGWTPDARTIRIDQFPFHWLITMARTSNNPAFQAEIERRESDPRDA